jgi:hypothetical protein
MRQYAVYVDRPHTGGCHVGAVRAHWTEDVRDQLPPSITRLVYVTAPSAAAAKRKAAKGGVRCQRARR